MLLVSGYDLYGVGLGLHGVCLGVVLCGFGGCMVCVWGLYGCEDSLAMLYKLYV